MTPEKVLEAVETYRKCLNDMHLPDILVFPHDIMVKKREHSLQHCHHVLDWTVKFVNQGNMEAAQRQLGFVQGVLWTNGVYDLRTLRQHNQVHGDPNQLRLIA